MRAFKKNPTKTQWYLLSIKFELKVKIRILESPPACATLEAGSLLQTQPPSGPRTHREKETTKWWHSCHWLEYATHGAMTGTLCRGLRGSRTRPLCPVSLTIGNSLQSAPGPSLSPSGRIQAVVNQGRERMQSQGETVKRRLEARSCFSISGYTQPLGAALQILTPAQSGRG